jgi:glycerate 2-kinase
VRILVAPDSFKGSLTAVQAGEIIKAAFCEEIPNVVVEVTPMADGGEGTLDAILAATKGTVIDTEVTGPMGEKVTSRYGIIDSTQTAVIETANIAGLTMVPSGKKDPMQTTSYGIGETILEAIQKGARDFIIGLGGSATNDGGLGMLMALGGKFYAANGKPVAPVAASLLQIKGVDLSGLNPALHNCTIKIASDVQNPLCGESGASYIFGPQKGATQEEIVLLDKGLKNFADLMESVSKQNLQQTPGAGAAGGLGFGFLTIGGKINSGAKIIAEKIGLEAKIKKSDWVITGEGKSDNQTVFGKAPYFIASLAKKHGIKAVLISGSLDSGYEKLLNYFVSCHSIITHPITLEEAMSNSKKYLYGCARNVARLIANASR